MQGVLGLGGCWRGQTLLTQVAHPLFSFPEFPVSKPDLLSRLDHGDEPTALDLHVPRDTLAAGEPQLSLDHSREKAWVQLLRV